VLERFPTAGVIAHVRGSAGGVSHGASLGDTRYVLHEASCVEVVLDVTVRGKGGC
jgi:hypothetical protein